MRKHPYTLQPSYCFWSAAVRDVRPEDVDPAVQFPFRLSPHEKIATAGSCFAQHIARHLKKNGFNYFVAERGHSALPQSILSEHQYGLYSARYGNVYTARQLLQLFDRAYGLFHPREPFWQNDEGRFVDPFRPSVQSGGFRSIVEAEHDRKQHLMAVRRVFEEADVLVFTLGLTEGWLSLEDGAVFPICPGVSAGEFDPQKYQFVNFRHDEVIRDLKEFLSKIREVNGDLKLILTVSPVPLAATMEDKHVWTATSYSKAALRVACEEMCRSFPNVGYFPSYEIITGQFARGGYYKENLRDVTDEGVEHVMRCFLRNATDGNPEAGRLVSAAPTKSDFGEKMEHVVDVICEEAWLDVTRGKE